LSIGFAAPVAGGGVVAVVGFNDFGRHDGVEEEEQGEGKREGFQIHCCLIQMLIGSGVEMVLSKFEWSVVSNLEVGAPVVTGYTEEQSKAERVVPEGKQATARTPFAFMSSPVSYYEACQHSLPIECA
jgi:hypothetical protein